jgi:hypothetical protein
MIDFKLAGKHEFILPSNYGELTLKQFFALRKSSGDIIEGLSILSGLDRSFWEQYKDTNIDEKILPYLEWMKDDFNLEVARFILPDKLNINGTYYKRPDSIGAETFGQKIALQKEAERFNKEGGNEIDLIPFVLALYFQKEYFQNKLYNSDQVQELIPLIMDCKISEAYPIASFFLINYGKSLQMKKAGFLSILARKKFKQESAGLKNSESLEQYTPFRRILIKTLRKFYSWITIRYSSRFGMKKNQPNTKSA